MSDSSQDTTGGIWSPSTREFGLLYPAGMSATPPIYKARKVGDWRPKNTIFSGFVANSDPDSAAALAVAVQHGGYVGTLLRLLP